MSEELDSGYVDEVIVRGPQSTMERRFIKEHLHSKGYNLEGLRRLQKEEARRLMKDACKYASLKLALIEARAQFINVIHGPSSC